jgi:hypothetical protein
MTELIDSSRLGMTELIDSSRLGMERLGMERLGMTPFDNSNVDSGFYPPKSMPFFLNTATVCFFYNILEQ